jgi:16S rRNA G966 N2-methylase RsmD
MASLLQEFKGKVDLIYIDPPFDVGGTAVLGRSKLYSSQITMYYTAKCS